MKGFYIEISNNLLDPKHRKAMKESVWLFMWLLDKITSVSEDGIGKVLGGKPIKYEEIGKELGISRKTYALWVERLKEHHYINTTRTPYGLVITVNKAKKVFGRGVQKITHLEGERDEKDLHRDVQILPRDEKNLHIQLRQYNDNNNNNNIHAAEPHGNEKPPKNEENEPKKTAKQDNQKPKSPHRQFIEFWYETAERARGIKPVITGKDARNLKRVLDMGILSQIQLEQLATYFLAHPTFRKFSPSIATFLSAGILNGLANRMRNDNEFWKELDIFASKYIKQNETTTPSEMVERLEQFKARLFQNPFTPQERTRIQEAVAAEERAMRR